MKTPSKLNDRSSFSYPVSMSALPTSEGTAARSSSYLWAVGSTVAHHPTGSRIEGDRYEIMAPHVWVDRQPHHGPNSPEFFEDDVLAYLYLYPYRLHVPEVYGFCKDDKTGEDILLLENAPLTAAGELLPSLVRSWHGATAVRQAYWLWQMLELWMPFWKLNVASSLLSPENLHVEGWRLRVRELIQDQDPQIGRSIASVSKPSLGHLAQCWSLLLPDAKAAIAEPLQALCEQIQADAIGYPQVAVQLNRLLLEQSARLPLRLQVQGATDIGRRRSHNEDTCYPLTATGDPLHDDLTPRLTIVCDGIGGHDGGEVASQLAVQALQMQVRALLTEVAEEPDPVSPEVMAEQLAAIVRVVNNVIAAQNDAQDRAARRRMGTTLVMALQIPQRVKLPDGAIAANAHELYLVNVGDSRAYWITPEYCHQLTVDDDVAVREVRMGRAVRQESIARPDAGALTQALGTRDSEYLHPAVQRFVLEEDGMLLLCSDGLSDNDLVERSWSDYAERILRGKDSLESTVRSWLAYANEQNGHDNASIVLTYCHVSSSLSDIRVPIVPPAVDLQLTETAPVESVDVPVAKPRRSGLLLWFIVFLVLSGAVGLGVWYLVNPAQVRQVGERITNEVRDRIPDTFLKR
ncbi:PP2C family protein-serine/threonine phosphatase [Myxacorys almedinensis]|uniref:SpoIIE family protein phosphatase n=1 Tax=Myxacorys almedinensis A TaxID=2690445 RepID=A0A8J7YZY8_9CYAN|nr:protein phosphatase 2C domain-containing protein [Myxacorys almedinensis]NDJ17639.1 SpoIIE family protein phosphatase [Myxacorys almedinensis A]